MICETCIHALQHTLKRVPVLERDGVCTRSPQDAEDYCEDRSDLIQSLARKCWICDKLTRFITTETQWSRYGNRVGSCPVKFTCPGLIFTSGLDNVLAQVRMEIEDSGAAKAIEIELQFVRSSGYFINLDVLDSKNTRDAFNTMSVWLNECQSHHEECQQKTTSYYPTRLLYVGKAGDDINLVITAMQRPRSPYLTLSHRWGIEDFVKLKSSTIDELQRRIKVSTLPLTFQEAIEVTRRLGFQYLWIDSLCIMQDEHDNSDWLRESSKMDEVYSNALLNLSATGTLSSSSSLFHDRDLETLVPSPIGIEIGHTMQQYHVVDGDMWADEITNAGLNLRAWVFQERLLARRVLHFGQRQLAWECRKLDAMELFPQGLLHKTYSALRKQEIGPSLERSDRQNSPENSRRAFSWWREIVSIYSRCSLTNPGDKLIALSGIAERMRHVTRDEYMAGMWRSTMAFDLPWWREDHIREDFPRTCSPYRAPSWSWASVDGEIDFPEMTGRVYGRFIDVVEAGFTYLSEPATTGGLIDGSIQIKCKPHTLFLVNLRKDMTFSSLIISGSVFNISRNKSDSLLSHDISDTELLGLNEKRGLYCVACCETRLELCGVVLEHSKTDHAYRRIGSFAVDISQSDEEEEEEEEETAMLASLDEKETPHNRSSLTSKNDESSAAPNHKYDAIQDAKSLDAKKLARVTLRALANALKAGFQGEHSIPCDFYAEESGQHIITII